MPNAIVKGSLQQMLQAAENAGAMERLRITGPAASAARVCASHGRSQVISARHVLSLALRTCRCGVLKPGVHAGAARDYVSMNRRALLLWLALGATTHALGDSVAREGASVQSLIEALRPLPATRGLGHAPAKAAATLSIDFDAGSARLTEQGRRSLDLLGAALASNELEGYDFRIEVYLETGPSASRDELLSKRQANTIKDYLVKQHQVSPRRLATEGRGSAHPLKRTNPASSTNRRVVVVNTSDIR
jgi:outer membrane protein OmpA-like peptidoglycan-associated protein